MQTGARSSFFYSDWHADQLTCLHANLPLACTRLTGSASTA